MMLMMINKKLKEIRLLKLEVIINHQIYLTNQMKLINRRFKTKRKMNKLIIQKLKWRMKKK